MAAARRSSARWSAAAAAIAAARWAAHAAIASARVLRRHTMHFRARRGRWTVAVVPAVLVVGRRRVVPAVARRHHGFAHFQRWLVRRAIKTVAIVIHPRLPAAVLLDAVVPRTASVVVLLAPALGRAVGPSTELAPTTAAPIVSTITARSGT